MLLLKSVTNLFKPWEILTHEWVVFVCRFNYNFHSIFTLWEAGCDFQYGPNFGVPSNPTFRLSWFFISWQSVLATSHWLCKLWELFSVFCHEVKCIDNFPPPLLLSVPRDNGLVARKTGCPLSLNVIIIISATLSHSPCGLLSWVEYHIFSEPGPKIDHLPVKIFSHQ